MEWAESGLRYRPSTMPNLNFTVPRRNDIAYLAAQGYTRTRLPIKWEMLQPMLNDTIADAATRAMIGEPGAFNANYESYITGVLDAHAAAGIKCMLDLHNYCRYRDFRFQSDGSVIGLTKPSDPLLYAYTSDGAQVFTRIFALAPGATLTQSNFVDFWTRAATKWMNHPGFGGYGLMNEPYNLPAPGTLEESYWGTDDLTIWPTYAQAAINAIRALDPANPIYLGGNEWSSAMSLGTKNPSWPLQGANIIYEVHMYLDAGSSGQRFDYDQEVALGYNAGFASGPITLDTGVDRLKLAVDYAQPRGWKLALTETGMPIDDPRWQEMFTRMLDYARANNVDVYSWNGGSHWPLRNMGITHAAGWHQNKTLEPSMSGPLKGYAGVDRAALFDDGPGWAPSGTPVTITVYARGFLASPVSVTVASSNGGSFSKTTLTLPAGANSQDSFSFAAPLNAITTLSYTSSSGSLPPPPPRRIYSLSDPVAYASTSVADAAMALIAKYSACKWEMAHGYTDYVMGAPAGDGQRVRAISDSGYGSSVGNAMEMLNGLNDESAAMGSMSPPTMRVAANGRMYTDHVGDTWGFWCKKTMPVAGSQPNPRNIVPYTTADAHFTLAALKFPTWGGGGIVFQVAQPGEIYRSELRLNNSRPEMQVDDNAGSGIILTGPAALPGETPVVISFTSLPGAQRLRVNSSVVASGAASFSARVFEHMMIGWGLTSYYPGNPFNGGVYSVITGKGAPTTSELSVLERYLGTTAGIAI